MKTRIVPIGCAAICVALLYAIAIAACAATITVINTNDSGPGSLRQALPTLAGTILSRAKIPSLLIAIGFDGTKSLSFSSSASYQMSWRIAGLLSKTALAAQLKFDP